MRFWFFILGFILAFLSCNYKKQIPHNIAKKQKDIVDVMFNKAILLYTNGDMYSAIPHFSFVLEKAKYTDYRYKLSLYFIARIYEVNGKIDEALEYYNRLLDVAPYFMEARFR